MSESDLCLKRFEPHLKQILQNWPTLVGKVGFVCDDWNISNKFPPLLAIYYYQAVLSFVTGNLAASIATSSASVEIAINEDERMQELRGQMKKWLNK